MSSYQPIRPDDSRLHYTGVLVAGDASDTVGHSVELATLEWVVQPHVLAWADRVPGRCEADYHQQIRDFAMPA